MLKDVCLVKNIHSTSFTIVAAKIGIDVGTVEWSFLPIKQAHSFYAAMFTRKSRKCYNSHKRVKSFMFRKILMNLITDVNKPLLIQNSRSNQGRQKQCSLYDILQSALECYLYPNKLIFHHDLH